MEENEDTFTTTTSRSWFGRIGGALVGALLGAILFAGSFFLLAWNEGRAIHRAKTLETGARQVVSISPESPAPANEGHLVHLVGNAVAEGPVRDPLFGISSPSLRLRRTVEMYQWKETEKSETSQKLGGGEETKTTYSYSKDWSSSLIPSKNFKKPSGHTNPGTLPAESETFDAEGIHVGGFLLPDSLIRKLEDFQPRPVTPAEAAAVGRDQVERAQATSKGLLYIGADPAAPSIGDLQVTFEAVPHGPVSIVAKQTGDSFAPFPVANLGSIELLRCGKFGADEMFRQEQESNKVLTWLIRLVGFAMMVFGILLVLNIFSVLAAIIPFLGDIVGAGVGLLAIAAAVPLSLATIALAWLAYRPLIGIPLALASIGSAIFGISKISHRKKEP